MDDIRRVFVTAKRLLDKATPYNRHIGNPSRPVSNTERSGSQLISFGRHMIEDSITFHSTISNLTVLCKVGAGTQLSIVGKETNLLWRA